MARIHGRMINRIVGMNIDRRLQGRRTLPEHLKARIVEIQAMGGTIDHHAGEAELRDATVQFVGGASRILHRDMGETAIALGVLLDLNFQKIIHLARAAGRQRCVCLGLHAGTGEAKDCELNAIPVHVIETATAEIREGTKRLVREFGRDIAKGRRPIVDEIGGHEMLFERDLPDHLLVLTSRRLSCSWRGSPVSDISVAMRG